jgi:cell shape-determining protein MreC
MLAVTPVRIYNTSSKTVKLQEKIKKYETANKKLKLLLNWNLRATHSALKTSQEISEIIDDLQRDSN